MSKERDVPKDLSQRHLSTAETASALGVTPRALRLYEARGLVRPLRTESGWRAYGPEAMARLHQVLTLKRLGLSLAAIGDLLKGRHIGLEQVLALQEEALAQRQSETARALDLVRRARAELKAGRDLSVDDLATLTRETKMTDKMSDQEMKAMFDPLAQKYFTPDELKDLETQKLSIVSQDGIKAEWDALIAEAQLIQAKGDPTTPEAIDLGRRWMTMVNRFSGGDQQVNTKVASMWKEAMSDPDAAPRLPFDMALWAFVSEAVKAGRT
jgi:DNA-binding transcriptional MerR regulator